MKDRKLKIGQVRSISDRADKTRQIEFIISDESRDRHGTVIPLRAWDLKPYLKNPVVFYMHDGYGDGFTGPNPDTLIGRAVRVWIAGSELRAVIEFEPAEINPLAEKVLQKILFGSLKAVSTGFIETERGSYGEGNKAKYGKEETYYFGKVELLEISIVNIPSNRNSGKRLAEMAPCVRRYAKNALDLNLKPARLDKLTLEDIEILIEGKDLGFDCTDPVEMRKKIWDRKRKDYARLKKQIAKDEKLREEQRKAKEKAAWDAKRRSHREYRCRYDDIDTALQTSKESTPEDSTRYSGACNAGYLYD